MLPVYEILFDVKYNFVIFPFILIGYALFCSTTQLMTKSTESLMCHALVSRVNKKCQAQNFFVLSAYHYYKNYEKIAEKAFTASSAAI